MKKRILAALSVLLMMMAISACGRNSENVQDAEISNPWRDITAAEAEVLCPDSFTAPDGAENVSWSVLDSAADPSGIPGPLVQLSFDLYGMHFTAREQITGSTASDQSGMYYDWTYQTEIILRNWGTADLAGTYFRFIGENGYADLCIWYDAGPGVSYSLSTAAEDLDGFDLQAVAEALKPSNAVGTAGRQNGERFEDVIILEGMEETVRYEHVRNDTLGFEMDYDYESFIRRSEADRESFLSIYDDKNNPENYLELTYRAEDADTVAASVRALLSQEYDLLESERVLERAGSCIRIEASELKGTGRMADLLQVVYIIPASDGCRVATEHFSIESAEGFGRRFSYMLDTLAVIDRRA